MSAKQKERERLAREMVEFVAAGGQVQVLPCSLDTKGREISEYNGHVYKLDDGRKKANVSRHMVARSNIAKCQVIYNELTSKECIIDDPRQTQAKVKRLMKQRHGLDFTDTTIQRYIREVRKSI